MNCPDCLKLNLQNKLILLPGIYVCENESCVFCEPVENIDEICRLQINNVANMTIAKDIQEDVQTQNINRISSPENETISDGIVTLADYKIKDFNQNCLKTEIHDIVIDIPTEINLSNEKEKINNNKELSCNEIVESIPDDSNSIKKSDNSDNIDTNQKVILNSDCFFENVEVIDLNEELINMNEFDVQHRYELNTTMGNIQPNYRNILRNYRSKTVEQVASDYFNKKIWETNNKILNWVRMPYYFKTHTKIVGILILNMDIFQFKDNHLFDELKREYSVCETFANHYRIDKVKPLCYKFLHQLNGIIDKIPNKNLIEKELDQRILCSMNRLFAKYDSLKHLQLNYRTEILCSFCHDNRTIDSNDYFVTLDKNKTNLNIHENQLSYKLMCSKCKNKSLKTVSLIKIPQFLIFHCPDGLRENPSRYENMFVSVDGKRLSLVAIVEAGSINSFSEYPEKEIDYLTYHLTPMIHDSRIRPSYCVHFRNTNGWHSVNGYKSFLCSPREELSMDSFSDVRFVIFGNVSDPHKYRSYFSILDFNKRHDQYILETLNQYFKTPNLALPSKKAKPKPISKKSAKNISKKKKPNSIKKNIDLFDNQKHHLEKETAALEAIQTFNNCPALSTQPFDHLSIGQNINQSDPKLTNLSILSNDLLNTSSKTGEIQIQSAQSSHSNEYSFVHNDSIAQKRYLDLDDLISKQYKKLKTNR